MWMEKALVRGDYTKDDFTVADFLETRLAYHRIESYLTKNTKLEYVGEAFTISCDGSNLNINTNNSSDYVLPHILYIPAERNIAAVVEDSRKLKNISGALIDFLSEYNHALKKLKSPVALPINNTSVIYNNAENTIYIKGNDYNIKLSNTASGFQSLVPLYLVSQYLYDSVKNVKNNGFTSSEEKDRFNELSEKILLDINLNDEQKHLALSNLGKRSNNRTFVNIIEEPEQNLFPHSQWLLLQKLLELNNAIPANKTIITTHSPYLINYLTLAVEANTAKTYCKTEKQKSLLSKIIPYESAIDSENLAIYELNEKDGSINRLKKHHGIPSDDNYLNNYLGESNNLFSDLLELEQKIEH
jgi:hypothetical protein